MPKQTVKITQSVKIRKKKSNNGNKETKKKK